MTSFNGQIRLCGVKMLVALQLLVFSVSFLSGVRIMEIATSVSDEHSIRLVATSYPGALYIAILTFGFSASINILFGFIYSKSKHEGAFGPRGVRWRDGTRCIPFVSNYVLLLNSAMPIMIALAPLVIPFA